MTDEDPHSQAANAVHEGRPVEAQYTKQGKGGRRISVVLGAAFVLTLVGFLVVYLLFSGAFRSVEPGNGNKPDDVAAFSDRVDVPSADAPTTSTGDPTNPPTGEAPNINAPVAPSQVQSE